MYYKNQDYTVWTREADGLTRYFIKFHSQLDSRTIITGIRPDLSGPDSKDIEIAYDIFHIYLKEFNKPLERQRNEKRRHIEAEDIENLIESGRLSAALSFEVGLLARVDAYAALEKCTEIQRRRIIMHYTLGYSFTEIAQIEQRDEAAVRRSIAGALKKLKLFLGDSPNPSKP
jgi:hypothetical protein